MEMKVYEIETGATWWVVAENLIQAFEVVHECWKTDDSVEDVATGGTLRIDELSEEQARKMKVQMDDEVASERLLWDLLRDATKPEVVACSEWP